MSDLLDTATVCYAANKAWNDLRGEDTLAFDEVRASIVDGVLHARAGNTPEQSHQSWLDYKVKEGWVYGEAKDPVAKTHPLMVPYADLPPEQRVKDDLFLAIVSALTPGKIGKLTPIHVVFQNRETQTGPEKVFIETETPDGKGLGVGEWVEGALGYSALRIRVPEEDVRRA